MNTLMTWLINGVAFSMVVTIGYMLKTAKRSLPDKETNPDKEEEPKLQNVDTSYPNLNNPNWKKIGNVYELNIYPVKSSKEALVCSLVKFRDFGMCELQKKYFWDGMFIVYNKTINKLEDCRRYPKLQSIMVTIVRNTSKVFFRYAPVDYEIESDIVQDRKRAPPFEIETWNEKKENYCSTNEKTITWLKKTINAYQISGTDENITLAHMVPRNWNSTQEIKNNWDLYVEGYKNMNEDKTGKCISLPRFVVITEETMNILLLENQKPTPNIVIRANESIRPFEEKYWTWIRIDENVILKKVQPVLSTDDRFDHYGVYFGLWHVADEIVKVGDKVFVYYDSAEVMV